MLVFRGVGLSHLHIFWEKMFLELLLFEKSLSSGSLRDMRSNSLSGEQRACKSQAWVVEEWACLLADRGHWGIGAGRVCCSSPNWLLWVHYLVEEQIQRDDGLETSGSHLI